MNGEIKDKLTLILIYKTPQLSMNALIKMEK